MIVPPAWVEATGGGVLFEPEHPQSLANEIEALLADPTRAQTLAQTGREAVRERFSAEAMARESLTVYQQVVPRATVAASA